jgi:hypothetical protein
MERRSAFGLAGIVTAAVLGIGGVALASRDGGSDGSAAGAGRPAMDAAAGVATIAVPDAPAVLPHATTRSS